MLFSARRRKVVGLLETPNSSKLKNLPSWKALALHKDFFSTRCDSCRYGSIASLMSFQETLLNGNDCKPAVPDQRL